MNCNDDDATRLERKDADGITPPAADRPAFHVLILGASYGSLLASKLVLAGHRCTLICRSSTAKVFNENGSTVRMPIRGRDGLLDVVTKDRLRACSPDEVLLPTNENGVDDKEEDEAYHLVVLAMQEPQYSAPDVRRLVLRVAAARLPVMAVTNMPLPPYLERIPILRGISQQSSGGIRSCYTDPGLWDAFIVGEEASAAADVGDVHIRQDLVDLFTQCSPDPQAFRPPHEPPNVLQVRLPTYFKAAAFGGGSTDTTSANNEMLKRMEGDIQSILYTPEKLELPVKLRLHDSVFVPLAKWAMLLAGNYRCIPPVVGREAAVISIAEAVGGDVETSRAVYEWVNDLVVSMGGTAHDDLVPFDKYLGATRSLQSPSSAARAVQGGATNIERVDKVVQLIGRRLGKQLEAVDEVVRNVDRWLAYNSEKSNAQE
jgi:hypothetical protein